MKFTRIVSCNYIISGFLFIVGQGVMFNSNYLYENKIPIKNYIFIAMLFFSTNVSNNIALSYEVDMPTVLIFRSGSLVANMIVSLIAFRRQYSISKYISVGLVTIGVLVSTAETATIKTQNNPTGDITTWLTGISLLAYGLFGSATMGVFQEKLFGRFGKHPGEALFYNHLIGLLGFIVSIPNIGRAVSDFNQSEPLIFGIPIMWCYLLLNVMVQNICVRSIYYLLSEWTSLAVTLVTTLRKFLSLLLSIVLFDNEFTRTHWYSTMLVFFGSALFSEIIKLPREAQLQKFLNRINRNRSTLPLH